MSQQNTGAQFTISDYIRQLQKDMDFAIERSGSYFKGFAVKNGTEGGEEYLPSYKCEGNYKMSEIFQIDKDCLPDLQQLGSDDINKLALKMEKLWNSYHFYADFPNALPIEDKYRLMRDKWDCNVKLASRGESHIEFCHNGPHDCQFNGYCTICNDLQDED
jgi:hypothetical protein